MKYELCKYSELESFDAWLASLSSPIESFLEGHLQESAYHRIVQRGHEAGFFAIHNGALLTQFYLTGEARLKGREFFAEILQEFKLQAALVPTCDEIFLSHALDQHAELKKQAFFFCDAGNPTGFEPKNPKLSYRLAELADIPALNVIEDSIIDDPEAWIDRRELHVGYFEGKLVAIGVIEPSKYWADRASIGLLTHESYRQLGIGTQTLLYLKQVCRGSGIMPVAGCGYGNTNSQKTLQAAGMVSMTRLLKLSF